MTSQQKKLSIVAVVAGCIYFSPALLRTAQQAVATITTRPAADSRPFSPAQTPSLVSSAPPKPAADLTMDSARLSGLWKGGSLVANRGRCETNIEITPDASTPNHYSGALVMHCVPAVLPFWGKTGQQAMNNGANALTPANAILSGTFKGNSLVFNVDKSIAGTCPITAATVTPFGSKELAIQWKDGCGDGDMILVR